VLKGSYSQYYEGIFNDIYKRATPGKGDFVTYDASACPNTTSSAASTAWSRPTAARTSSTAWTRTSSIRGWTRRASARARDQQRRAPERDRRLPRQQEHDRLRAPLGALDAVLPDQRARPVHDALPWTNRAASEDDKIVTNPDGFQFKDPSGNVLGTLDMMKRYKALMFVASKRFSHRWHGQISYVLSKSYGNVDNNSEASFGNNSSTNGGGGAYAYETPNVSLVNAQGELTNSRRHEVKVLLGVQVPKIDLGVNAYFRALSGRPYTPISSSPAA
jgi:hypothetical protein